MNITKIAPALNISKILNAKTTKAEKIQEFIESSQVRPQDYMKILGKIKIAQFKALQSGIDYPVADKTVEYPSGQIKAQIKYYPEGKRIDTYFENGTRQTKAILSDRDKMGVFKNIHRKAK